LKRYLAIAAFAAFMYVLWLLYATYPEHGAPDLPQPPSWIFGTGEMVNLQNQLSDQEYDLYWLAGIVNKEFERIGTVAMLAVCVVMGFQQLQEFALVKTGKTISLPLIPRRYTIAMTIALLVGAILDMYWMRFSLRALHLHLTCLEILSSEIAFGLVVIVTWDQLQKLNASQSIADILKPIGLCSASLAFGLLLLYSGDLGWPCHWFMSACNAGSWAELASKPAPLLIILLAVYIGFPLYLTYVLQKLLKSLRSTTYFKHGSD
jgi:hypothetical protein